MWLPNMWRMLVLAMAAVLLSSPSFAQDQIKVVASFSILGDLVKQVGGSRIALTTLVGPNGDAHVYEPTPSDARRIGEARVVFVNGLGLEGWITRLVAAAGGKASLVAVSKGIKPLRMEDEHKPGHMITDPHAWQSIANAKIYVANIRDALIVADPAGKDFYDDNASRYLGLLERLETEVTAAIGKIPDARRRIITTHDAFGYFGAAYGVAFISPEGVSTESQASARDVAKIITQIRKQTIPAVFMENISDPRLMQQIARETGARIGGTLYSDALSDTGGPAATYIDMMRNNIRQLSAALAS